jgi:hypothetical protein
LKKPKKQKKIKQNSRKNEEEQKLFRIPIHACLHVFQGLPLDCLQPRPNYLLVDKEPTTNALKELDKEEVEKIFKKETV